MKNPALKEPIRSATVCYPAHNSIKIGAPIYCDPWSGLQRMKSNRLMEECRFKAGNSRVSFGAIVISRLLWMEYDLD